jgi:hypothetical protein
MRFPRISFCLLAVAALLLGLPVRPVLAVQVYGTSGTGSSYATAPVDDFGFANVGQVYNSVDGFYCSGVYLGNGWVLTAYHAVRDGAGGFRFGNVILNGTGYAVNTPTAVRLTTPGTGAPVDLAMVRLATLPDLPSIAVASSTPAVNASLVLMGNGIQRGASLLYWRVDQTTNPWTWSSTNNARNADASGYAYDSAQSLRWGNGSLAAKLSIDDGFGTMASFYSTFASTNGSAMAAAGDSGGGVFYKTGTNWNLCGIMLTIATYNGQPANTSVVGDATYVADLASFATQINTLVAVQPPTILRQPVAATMLQGGSATLSVSATAAPVAGYQWQRLPVGSGIWGNISDLAGTYAGATTGTLTLSNATLAMNGDQFRCVVSNGYPPDVVSDAALLTVQTAYQAWAVVCFGTQAVNAAISGPLAMPQQDGVSNALKYLANIDPTQPMTAASRAALPTLGVTTVSGSNYATLTYRQRTNLGGLQVGYQKSADLINWSAATPDAVQTLGSDPVTGDPLMQARFPMTEARQFYRLQVSGF